MSTKAETSAPAVSVTTSEEVAKKLHEAIDRFTVHANAAEERILQATGNLEGLLKNSKQNASEKAEEVTDTVKGYVDEHPLASLGIAFGAGLLLAALLRRG